MATDAAVHPGIEVEVEIIQDIAEEVEDYVRLVRCRKFKEADQVFRAALQQHATLFPIAAEHCECLLEQGDFRSLGVFLDYILGDIDRQALFSEDERALLLLYRAFWTVRVKGTLSAALLDVTKADGRLPARLEDLDEVQVQILILALSILTLDKEAITEDIRTRFCKHSVAGRTYTSLPSLQMAWFNYLYGMSRYWDAVRVVDIAFELDRPSNYLLADVQRKAEKLIDGHESPDRIAGMMMLSRCLDHSSSPFDMSDEQPSNGHMKQIASLLISHTKRGQKLHMRYASMPEQTLFDGMRALNSLHRLATRIRSEEMDLNEDFVASQQDSKDSNVSNEDLFGEVVSGIRQFEANEDFHSCLAADQAVYRYAPKTGERDFTHVKRLWRLTDDNFRFIQMLIVRTQSALNDGDSDYSQWGAIYDEIDSRMKISDALGTTFDAPSVRGAFIEMHAAIKEKTSSPLRRSGSTSTSTSDDGENSSASSHSSRRTSSEVASEYAHSVTREMPREEVREVPREVIREVVREVERPPPPPGKQEIPNRKMLAGSAYIGTNQHDLRNAQEAMAKVMQERTSKKSTLPKEPIREPARARHSPRKRIEIPEIQYRHERPDRITIETISTEDGGNKSSKPIETTFQSSTGETALTTSGSRSGAAGHYTPVFPKIHKKYLKESVILARNIPYWTDPASPDHVILGREMTKEETDELFEVSRRIRDNHSRPRDHYGYHSDISQYETPKPWPGTPPVVVPPMQRSAYLPPPPMVIPVQQSTTDRSNVRSDARDPKDDKPNRDYPVSSEDRSTAVEGLPESIMKERMELLARTELELYKIRQQIKKGEAEGQARLEVIRRRTSNEPDQGHRTETDTPSTRPPLRPRSETLEVPFDRNALPPPQKNMNLSARINEHNPDKSAPSEKAEQPTGTHQNQTDSTLDKLKDKPAVPPTTADKKADPEVWKSRLETQKKANSPHRPSSIRSLENKDTEPRHPSKPIRSQEKSDFPIVPAEWSSVAAESERKRGAKVVYKRRQLLRAAFSRKPRLAAAQ